MVAQKPAGNFKPLSSPGHAAASARRPAEGAWAGDAEALAQQAPNSANTDQRFLQLREKRMAQPPKNVDA
jgi:hypothetical protein